MYKELKKFLNQGEFDGVTKKTRKTMSAIRGKNNKSTELRLRMVLIKAGLTGWTLNNKEILGKPDFYFEGPKLAIFVDGCFWHGCPKCGHIPKTRSSFWENKIAKNKERDKKTKSNLKKLGITSLRIWEHELENTNLTAIIKRIKSKSI